MNFKKLIAQIQGKTEKEILKEEIEVLKLEKIKKELMKNK